VKHLHTYKNNILQPLIKSNMTTQYFFTLNSGSYLLEAVLRLSKFTAGMRFTTA